MITLRNGCSRSEIVVTPSNWNTLPEKASAKLMVAKWRICYRYYDPAFKNNPDKWGQQFQIKGGINAIKDLATRQAAVKVLIEHEKDLLDEKLYNPVTGKYHVVTCSIEDILPSTPFIEALKKAAGMLICVQRMMDDINCAIRGVEAAAAKLFDQAAHKPYLGLKINQVSRKHIVYIFEQCKKDNKKFSINRQNKYRAYLMMIYKQLVKLEAVEHNPIVDIPVEKGTIKKVKQLFTKTEMLLININLKAWDYHFWRYMRIFHRSGSRTSELTRLKPDKVSLESQEFVVLVKKGKQYVEQVRPIPDDILPLWIEVMEETKHGQFLFSEFFKPGLKQIDKSWVERRWDKYVQGYPEEWKDEKLRRENCLYIKKTFYLLKSQNTDAIDKALDLEHAAAADGHTNTTTTKNHYAIGHNRRKLEKLKRTEVPFS
jgi:site-specific recombinase XerC